VVAWLFAAYWIAIAVRRRPDAGRITAWLSLVSLAVLAGSIAWGVLGSTRHGKPAAVDPVAAHAITVSDIEALS
jgi:hypothetical protein